ncbi:MAG: hypothetical protein KC925_00255 [Candidatus Doudnabacteria bacterium]|nr:hypothetical protein [Candidatus Doudnabacteria bacterium]MCA9387526.1 hypothetical protein [Candidatus Andersenbacteria bacterium]
MMSSPTHSAAPEAGTNAAAAAEFGMDMHNMVHEYIKDLNPRTKEIVVKRFGLDGKKPRTLEQIGRSYGITRERVRQIQAGAMKDFRQSEDLSVLSPIESILENIIVERGNIMRHDHVLDVFADRTPGEVNPYVVEFVLELSNRFTHHPETELTHRAWATEQGDLDVPTQVINAFITSLQDSGEPLPHDATVKCVLDHDEAETYCHVVTDGEIVASYLAISKKVRQNPFGEWGLTEWTEISPKGVKDKAYVILKKAGDPLHFTDITERINASGLAKRPAIPQTVHNELIKDERFVLVGRGIYALREWGYEPGTVADVAARVLKNAGGTLSRDEIVDEVLKQRMVKKNTVLLALQDKDRFKKHKDGMFELLNNN